MILKELLCDDIVFPEQLLRFLTHKKQQILSFAIRCQDAARKYVELRLSSWKLSREARRALYHSHPQMRS